MYSYPKIVNRQGPAGTNSPIAGVRSRLQVHLEVIGMSEEGLGGTGKDTHLLAPAGISGMKGKSTWGKKMLDSVETHFSLKEFS